MTRARRLRLTARQTRATAWQAGVALVEFALVVTLFVVLLLGIADLGRWMFALNASSEATRLGARLAVVCDVGAAAIRTRMQSLLPAGVGAGNIDIEYLGASAANPDDWQAGCTVETCAAVRVQVRAISLPSMAWFLPARLPLPTVAVTLPRESLRSVLDGSPNRLCN